MPAPELKRVGSFACILLMLASGLHAAEVIRKDGTTVRGEIVSEDESKVVVNVSRAGMSSRVSIPRSDIADINRAAAPSATPGSGGGATSGSSTSSTMKGEPTPPPVIKHAGPVYYVIPLRGKVGVTIVASVLEKSLADAATRNPSAVILQIDSPGGLIQEVENLIDVIEKHKKKVKIVVWTKEALSAAAITALSVDDIYVQKGATFGAATAWRMTPRGTPEAVAEKMASIWRARGRSAAELGNHSPLLAESMIDPSKPLYLGTENGKPAIFDENKTGSTLFKEPGKILALTAREAVACGLAKGIADSPAELGQALGFANWKECQGVAVELANWWEQRVDAADKNWKATMGRLDESMRSARSADPGGYNDYAANDLESVRKWNERTGKCANFLRAAENHLTALGKLADEYPHLGADRESIDSARRVLAEFRANIEANKVRVIRR